MKLQQNAHPNFMLEAITKVYEKMWSSACFIYANDTFRRRVALESTVSELGIQETKLIPLLFTTQSQCEAIKNHVDGKVNVKPSWLSPSNLHTVLMCLVCVHAYSLLILMAINILRSIKPELTVQLVVVCGLAGTGVFVLCSDLVNSIEVHVKPRF